MSPPQRRWLTQPNSKVGKAADLPTVLRKDSAWETLPVETRRELYDLLPPKSGGEAHDININPLKTDLRSYIEEEIRSYQDDLNDGKETKKWREEAIQAGQERASGVWAEWQDKIREDDWCKREGFEEKKIERVTEEEARDAAKVAANTSAKVSKIQ
ncbi:hypothetical protein CKM354_000924000 [Cercospora kikuchii]|uniref:ASX DEUBAD domain-containing protein n=1 Tax=Cercospora kikuchii TaxID=84275 RepID=A0A9P3CP74_9PEZI|nr:uncharacterized protein CKM354_000924000 [Cercospora kikuchii]GIZ46101.1 hypothetical protein CKM354_000924000 [Cercospora kikuchii]